MKRVLILIMMMAIALSSQAVIIDLTTDPGTTGDNLDNLTPSGSTVSVAEISGLNITATFGATNGVVSYLNAVDGQLGINSDLPSEGTSYFDTGEWVAFSFDNAVNVTRFKFANFTATGPGDSVKVTWETTVLTLTDSDLNGSNEYVVDWNVGLGETIRFDALSKSADTTTGGFGLVEMDITVVPEPATLSLIGIAGLLTLVANRIKNRG